MALVLQSMRPRIHQGLVHHHLHAWLIHLPSLERSIEPANLLRPVEDHVRLASRLLHAHASVMRPVLQCRACALTRSPPSPLPPPTSPLERDQSVHMVTLVNLCLLSPECPEVFRVPKSAQKSPTVAKSAQQFRECPKVPKNCPECLNVFKSAQSAQK